MSVTKVEFFRVFLDTTDAVREIAQSSLSEYRAEFEARTTGQNPLQAGDYARRQLEQVEADEQLLSLYNAVTEFMSPHNMGAGLAEDMPLVEEVAALALRLSSKSSLASSMMPMVADAIGQELAQDMKRDFLTHFLEQNAGKVQEYRMRQVEKASRDNRNSGEPYEDDFSGYTLAQQALALQFLLTEGMDVSGVDQTKIIALAHLLSGKKIPMRNGKENIGNSGIKTAFAKIREKQDKHRLSDLRFVLRFFKPFENTPSEGMKRIIQAIEVEIAKTEERLSREKL